MSAAQDAAAQQILLHGVKFSEAQLEELAAAAFDAEIALLRAIAREAGGTERFDAARNIPRLVASLQALRTAMGQNAGVGAAVFPMTGFMGYTPSLDDPIGIDDEVYED